MRFSSTAWCSGPKNAFFTGQFVPPAPIEVIDEGEGFDPEEVANPLAPENLLKASGRGIFLIRNFMDDVQLRRAPQGGMEIRMARASVS